MAKFIHYVLQMENCLESEPLVGNSKIVQFLRHIKVYYGIEDESVIRVLLLLGYENEALYLICTENYTVSPEVFITAIQSEAYILALLMQGGCKYIQQCLEEHKVWIYDKKSKTKFQSYDYKHPVNGYSISLFDVKDQFNGALLRKLKTRPQYLEIFLFIWRRNIELVDQYTAQEILSEIEAQIDFAVSSNRSDGGFLRFVSNPLKVCILEIEFVMALKTKFSHIFSKSINALEALKGIVFNIQEQIRLDESSFSEDAMRYILSDQDFSCRSVLNIISQHKFLLELLEQPIIDQIASQTWEGPFRMDKSFIPRSSVNRELLSRFFTDKQGQERPIPIALKCKAKRCCFRRKSYQNYSLESEQDEIEEIRRRERSTCKVEECSFDIGFSYVNNELAKNNRQYETIPMYQFECWMKGQQLRFYESYVFEYIIFFFVLIFIFTIRSKYLALDLTSSEALDQFKSLDSSMVNLVYLTFAFFGVPIHYFMLLCFYKLNGVRGRALFNAQSILDILLLIKTFMGSVTIIPSFFETSNQIRNLKPDDPNLVSSLTNIKENIKNSHIWIYYSLFTGLIWLHVALSLRVSKSLGPLYKVLRLNFYDFMIWMTMIIITLSMFSVAGIMLSVDVVSHPCSGFKPCIIMYFEASMGSISFSEQAGVVAAQGLLIVCIIINLVLLFTVLIAMLTDSYEKIVSKAHLYFIKDIFQIARTRKIDDKFGSFMSLDFPFTLFPGSLILMILHCKNRNYLKETNEEERRSKLESIKYYNKLYLKFPAYALAWIIITFAILCVNIITIPLVWLLIMYNEVKILSNPDLVDMSKRLSSQSNQEYEELSPQIFEHIKITSEDSTNRPQIKKNSRTKRFFSMSLWIFLFGLIIVAFSTLIDTIKFCCSFWRSQHSILQNLQKTHKNTSITFERHQRTYRLNMRPRSVSSLATLAYEQLYENYERRNKKKNGEKEESIEHELNQQRPGERTILHMRAQSSWRKQKHDIESTPNTMRLSQFASKLEKELNLKGFSKEQNQSTLEIVKPEKPKDPFFHRANSQIPKSDQNDSGMTELSEREVFRRLLLNFSVKRSKFTTLNENLHTHQEINMETEEIFKAESKRKKISRYLYLDCLVGIYSNLLILSKLQEFTKHPSRIPPSVRLNALDTLDREFSEVHTLRAQDSEFLQPKVKPKSKFKDGEELSPADKVIKRLPTAVRLEEGSYMKFYQIQGIFFSYRLQRLISALCAYYSQSYRKKYTLGEIKKCSHYIAKVRKHNFKEKNETVQRLQTFQRAITMSSQHSLERKYSATRSPGTINSMPMNKNFHLIPQEAEEDEKSDASYKINDLEQAYEQVVSQRIMSPEPRIASPDPRAKESSKTAVLHTHRLLSDTRLSIQGLKQKAQGKIAWDDSVRGKVPEPISDSKEELEFMIKR